MYKFYVFFFLKIDKFKVYMKIYFFNNILFIFFKMSVLNLHILKLYIILLIYQITEYIFMVFYSI